MDSNTNLTNDLQLELHKMGSPVQLLNDSHSSIKLNYKDWAWADRDSRSIQASTFIAHRENQLQLEEKGLIAGTASTKDLKEIAAIIDRWLSKLVEIDVLAKEYNFIDVNERYWKLKTLPVPELLTIRWAKLSEEIAAGKISFRKDVFEKCKEHFSFLFPIFSHDHLTFSNTLELSNDDFRSPYIFCDGEHIAIGFHTGYLVSATDETFRTIDIPEAMSKVEQLLPANMPETFNPLAV